MVPYDGGQQRPICSSCARVCSCDPVYGHCKYYKRRTREQDSVITVSFSAPKLESLPEQKDRRKLKNPIDEFRKKQIYRAIQEQHNKRR